MKKPTKLSQSGRNSEKYFGLVNPPLTRGSTYLAPDAKTYRSHTMQYYYGREGSPIMRALEEALLALEDAERVLLCPCGLSAISTAFLSLCRAGDHVLVVDTVYSPARDFLNKMMSVFGVETTYYSAYATASDLEALRKPNTKLLYLESPGSLTMEIQDIDAHVAWAKQNNLTTIMDNTWATPLFFNPLQHGIDISITSATKYYGGHSDILMGTLAGRGEAAHKLRKGWDLLGMTVAADDCYAMLRSLRTLDVRLKRHQENAIQVANWLRHQSFIEKVLHPAFHDHPDHARWAQYFKGSSGLFTVLLKPFDVERIDAFLDSLTLFGIGVSWGGYESLAIPFSAKGVRSVMQTPQQPAIRFHIGLEDADDLIADMENAAKVLE